MTRITRSASLLLALAPAAGVATLHAQTAPSTAGDTSTLRPVVVTATRVDVPLAAPNASVTVLRGDDLRARGLATAADALREVPGVAVVQSGSFGGATSLFMRGGQNNYTKVLVDGAPANAPGGAIDLAYLTLDNVERIEVVRGPASVLYGSDAVTGVVQIFTRRGTTVPARLNGMLRGGSYGTRDGQLALAGTSGATSYSLGGARYTTDGILPVNNGFRNGVASGSVRYAPSALGAAQLTARYSDGVFHYPTSGGGWVPALADSNAFTASRRLNLALDAGRFLAPKVEARVLLTESRVDDRGENAPDGPADTAGFYSRFTSDTYRRAADARVNLDAAAGHVLTAGIEASRQGLATSGWSQAGGGVRQSDAPFDTARRTTAYYAQWVGRLAERASVTAGARLDDNQYFGTFGTYRVALGVRGPRGVTLRGAAGTAFKEPTFGEQFNTAFTNGNAALNPERSRSWEAGVDQTLGERATASVTYFDQRFRDLVVYQFSVDRDRPDYANVAAATARGVEAELRGRVAPPLDAGLAYTYVHTAVDDAGTAPSIAFTPGRPLLRRPRATLTGDLRFRPAPGTATALVVGYVGARPDVEFLPDFSSRRVRLGGYTKVDLSADVRVAAADGARPAAALTLRVDNALDREFEALRGFPSPGRVVLAGVRFGP